MKRQLSFEFFDTKGQRWNLRRDSRPPLRCCDPRDKGNEAYKAGRLMITIILRNG